MSTTGMSGTGEGADQDVTRDLDQRLSGDLAALRDFAQELAPRGNRPGDESCPGDPGGTPIPGRINADPDTVEHDLARLVLALIELIRRLLEKQAIRRVEAGSLGEDDIERLGEILLKLEQKMDELKTTFGLQEEDLDLNLGPLGDLVAELQGAPLRPQACHNKSYATPTQHLRASYRVAVHSEDGAGSMRAVAPGAR